MAMYTHEWLCQHIVEQTQEAIIFADCEGIIRLWNAGAETIFGYQAEEAIGQSLDLIIPERLQNRHWDGYRRVMSTGITQYDRQVLAVPAIRKDGERSSLEFTVVLLRAATGDILGVAAILRDVTVRWQQEKALQARLAALERKT